MNIKQIMPRRIGALVTMLVMGALIGLGGNDAFADSTLHISIDNSTVSMNALANNTNGTFVKSGVSTITAYTDHITGYTLKIMGNNSDYDKLIDSNNSDTTTNHLDSITSATTEEAFKAVNNTAYNGKWGYLPSKYCTGTTDDTCAANTSFLPAPSTAGSTLDVTTAANVSSPNSYTLATGARVDSSVKMGSYTNTYNVIMVANAIPYSITYNDGVVTNMPTDVAGTSQTTTVAIDSKVPVRSGYNFLGWCAGTVTNTNGTDSCSGTTYAAGSNYTLSGSSSNALALTAMWQVVTQSSCPASPMISTVASGITYMQNITSSNRATVLASLTTNATYQIKDNRDNETYCVSKLADGNLWMLDNLALDLTNSTVLNAMSESNTNASSTTLGYLKNGGGTTSDKYAITGVVNWTDSPTYASSRSFSDPLVNMASKDVIPTDATSTAGGYKIGSYYNYCAASAGSYCYGNGTSYGTSSGNATESICPAGWRMPTGNTSGEFSALANAIYGSTSSTSDATAYANYRSALHLPLSGYFNNGSPYGQGSNGLWWSSTRINNNTMYGLYANTPTIYPADSSNRSYGYSLRCVAGS